MKKLILKILGIETYELENNRLAQQNNNLAMMLEDEKQLTSILIQQVDKLKKDNEKILNEPSCYVNEQVATLEQVYKQRIKETETNRSIQERIIDAQSQDIERYKERLKTEYNRGFRAGETETYERLEVKVLKAKENGNTIVVDPDGDLVEEINIDDLVDIM